MYEEVDKGKEEEILRQALKDKFHEDFVSNALQWKEKLRNVNEMLREFAAHIGSKFQRYNYDSFCRVCYYAISDVIDEKVTFFSVYPTELEAEALKDMLITQERFDKSAYVEILESKRKEKFVHLQLTLSQEMEKKMLKFLVENHFKGQYERFVLFKTRT